jgi:hypothetical protein
MVKSSSGGLAVRSQDPSAVSLDYRTRGPLLIVAITNRNCHQRALYSSWIHLTCMVVPTSGGLAIRLQGISCKARLGHDGSPAVATTNRMVIMGPLCSWWNTTIMQGGVLQTQLDCQVAGPQQRGPFRTRGTGPTWLLPLPMETSVRGPFSVNGCGPHAGWCPAVEAWL